MRIRRIFVRLIGLAVAPGVTMRLDNPVLVTGTPRSGKSCVTHLLNHLPEFHRIAEPLMVWDIGMGSRPDDRRGADEVTPALREKIVGHCASLIAGQPGARYLDDLAYHALRIPFIHALMPEARIIHVIRSAEDSVPEMMYGWSYKDTVSAAVTRRRNAMRLRTLPRLGARFLRNLIVRRLYGRRATWGPRVPDMQAFARTHGVAEIAAYQWLMMVRIARDDLASLPKDRWLEVRFDHLLRDPAGEARRIGAFCRVKDIRELESFASRYVNPNHVFDKRVEPDEAEWRAIRELVHPLQVQLGYAR